MCKLDPEASPDARIDGGLPLTTSPARTERTRHAWRSLGMVVALSIAGVVGLPSNVPVDRGGGQRTTLTEQARVVDTGGIAFAAMPLLPAVPVLQGASSPGVMLLASAPRMNAAPSHADHNTAHKTQPASATRVATARVTKPVARPAQPQLASGDTSSGHPAQAFAAGASVPPAPVAVTKPVSAPVLGDALAPCARESVFARTWCEHQARLRYCDIRRGAPECATSANEDHGG